MVSCLARMASIIVSGLDIEEEEKELEMLRIYNKKREKKNVMI